MKAKDILVGGRYLAKVSGKLTTVVVLSIDETFRFGKWCTNYSVRNLASGREVKFRSPQRFRAAERSPANA